MRRFTRAYLLGIHRFKTDKTLALDVFRKYLQVDDPSVLEDTYAQFSSYIPDVPYVSEAGLGRLIEDLTAEEPRLAGRQPSEWLYARYLRELEDAGFVRQVVGSSPAQ